MKTDIRYEDKWKTQLKHHYEAVTTELKRFDKNMSLLGIFLYGSQNYGVAFDDSDVDTIAIIVPSMQYITENTDFYSDKMVFQNGDTCILRDIRKCWRMIKNQDKQMLECLFTPYKEINLIYSPDWANIFIGNCNFDKADELAFMYPDKTLASMLGILTSLVNKARELRHCNNLEQKKRFCKYVALGQHISLFIQGYINMIENNNLDYAALLYNKDNIGSIKSIKCGEKYFNGTAFSYCDWFDMFKQIRDVLVMQVERFKESDAYKNFIATRKEKTQKLQEDTARQISEFIWHLNRV